jgi:hypothetical protein
MKLDPTSPARVRLGGFASAILVALAGLLFAQNPSAHAHQPGTSSILLKVEESGVLSGEVHVADVDLASIELMLRERARRSGTSDTVAAASSEQPYALAAALPWLVLEVDGRLVPFRPGPPEVAVTDERVHTMVRIQSLDTIATDGTLAVEYDDFFAFDPQHKVVTSLERAGTTQVGLLSYEKPRWTVEIAGRATFDQFLEFTWEGVWHIWIGIDHILFLLALLLPAVLRYENGAWRPAGNFREALINVFKVVTAFTVAHSITLSLAALEIVTLPGKFVESVIAFSVLLAAANNIWPLVHDRAWLVAFGFGLIHGFGFANVLADLSLPAGTLAIALLSFNLGVELGQLAIVAVFFPIAFALRAHALYQPLKLRAGSAVIAVIAVGWIVQRVFELEVLPF